MKNYINIIENPTPESWPEILERPTIKADDLKQTVSRVFQEVQNNGDEALRAYTKEYDLADITNLQVSKDDFSKASEGLSDVLKQAMRLAKENIEKFHDSQRETSQRVETSPGVWCWQEKRPIEKIGLYIPGGTAPLFSTVLMLAIPARLAGCKEILLCTPPDRDGNISPAILYAAQLCGVSKVFKVGGIQAIAALSLGTESISKVYKIFGPGNQYVTAAKQVALQRGTAIDLPAGPSEVLVIADKSADPGFVAADLLSQAEHGTDSQAVLISDSKLLLSRVQEEIGKQLKALPRQQIAVQALDYSRFIYMKDKQMILDLVNEYAPEHLIVNAHELDFYANGIQNAGSVFLGSYSPESAGDYASGTNHTLPTAGYAKQYSGVNLDSFLKTISFQQLTKAGLEAIGPAIQTMAEAEGLFAHKNAVSIRINQKN